jgi:hypothetical protein
MPLHQLVLERSEAYLFHQVYFLADAALGVCPEVARILHEERVLRDDGDRSRVVVDILHALHILDHHEIASLEPMGRAGGHSPPFLIGDIADADLGKLHSRVEHLPLLPKISGKQAKEAQLEGVHDHSLGILLRADELVDGHHPAYIVDIAEDDHIVLQAILLTDLRIQLVHVHLVVEPVAQLDQVIGSRLLPDIVLPVVCVEGGVRKVL